MEQPENETKDESQLVLSDEEEKVQLQDIQIDDGLLEPNGNATFLTDLNLLIVALSLSSICNEDCLDLVDTDDQNKDIKEDREAPRLHARKRETNDVKLMRRQTQKTKTIPKDFRHCRKM
ncbi:hypothetical protein REPUB_Repub12eG0170500 [Reevesia pubescens]